METNLTMHFVCTMSEAANLISTHSKFWVSNCGCRERKGTCSQSRHDVCLMFNSNVEGSGGKKEK